MWDAASGTALVTIRPDKDAVASVAYSPDGSEIGLGMLLEKDVRLFNASNGTPLDVFRGDTDVLNSIAFSPDGRQVATASDDGTARIWSVPPRRRCQELIDEARRALPRQLSDAQRAEDYLGPRAPAPLVNPFGWSDGCR